MSTFSERLKELRAEKKVTQRDVAIFLGITDRAYQYYEYGSREPSIGVAQKLADYFEVPTDYLIGRSDNRYYTNTQTSQNVLLDKRLSMDAKSLYIQFDYFSLNNKVMFSGEGNFFTEYYTDKEELDGLIDELESTGYIKIERETEIDNGKNPKNFYVLLAKKSVR